MKESRGISVLRTLQRPIPRNSRRVGEHNGRGRTRGGLQLVSRLRLANSPELPVDALRRVHLPIRTVSANVYVRKLSYTRLGVERRRPRAEAVVSACWRSRGPGVGPSAGGAWRRSATWGPPSRPAP